MYYFPLTSGGSLSVQIDECTFAYPLSRRLEDFGLEKKLSPTYKHSRHGPLLYRKRRREWIEIELAGDIRRKSNQTRRIGFY